MQRHVTITSLGGLCHIKCPIEGLRLVEVAPSVVPVAQCEDCNGLVHRHQVLRRRACARGPRPMLHFTRLSNCLTLALEDSFSAVSTATITRKEAFWQQKEKTHFQAFVQIYKIYVASHLSDMKKPTIFRHNFRVFHISPKELLFFTSLNFRLDVCWTFTILSEFHKLILW